MGDSAMVVRHASRVIKSVRGEQRATVASHVAKSWNRCLTEYGMQPSGARATHVLEAAAAALKDALKGDDVEDIKAKTNTLAQASMKLGEAMYKAQQDGAAAGDAAADGAKPAEDDVVDADFKEVKRD